MPSLRWDWLFCSLEFFGAELFLSRISLVILLAGIVLAFGGHQLLKLSSASSCWYYSWPSRFLPLFSMK